MSQHSGKHMIWRHGAQHLTAGRYIISIDQLQHSHASLTDAILYCQDSVVYSGADDCMFKGWDLRQPDSSPIFVNRSANEFDR